MPWVNGGFEARDVASSGNYTFYASPNAYVGLACRKPDGTTVSDFVSLSVLATQASLVVTSPNGGEQIPLLGGSNLNASTIRWTQKGLSTVSIALYRNDQWQKWLVKDFSTDKSLDDTYSYSWAPNADDSSYYGVTEFGKAFKIYITGQKADGTGYVDDKSDAPFGFIGGPATPTPTVGTYRAYFNNSTYPNILTEKISQADALANCKLNASSNPNSSVRCTWNDVEIYSTAPAPVTPTGSAVPASWEANAFSVYKINSVCTGDKFVGYSSKYAMWVGAQLCGSSDKYKLYMSTSKTGVYYQIADYGGHGQDHCELINSSFTIPNDDDITSGTCKNCAVGNLVDVQNEPVFARSKLGETFKQVDSTYWADLTTDYYKCGVSIGSNTTSLSSDSQLANALTALEALLNSLISKLQQ